MRTRDWDCEDRARNAELSVVFYKTVIQKQLITDKCSYFHRILNRVQFVNVRIRSLCRKQMTHCEITFSFAVLIWKPGNLSWEAF